MAACPSCGARNPADGRACLTCGVGLRAVCAGCGLQAPPGARFCPGCGSPLEGGTEALERKLVTVLFADIAGSTALGERLDPERLRVVLDTCFSSLAASIETWGGTVEKFIGDAVVAIFGVPLAHEDDAERAVRAALDVLGRLATVNAELVARHRVRLSLRVGIATGEVIALTGGAAHQRLVTGDTVNLAARLQQTAELGTIVVDARTTVGCRGACDFSEPFQLTVKGKGRAVTAHHVLAARAQPSRGARGLRAAMVGRERELEALLLATTDAVENRHGRLVTVEGPPGIGKTRLVDEFQRRLAARHLGARLLKGRCPSIGEDTTSWPLAEMLRGLCGISLDESVSAAVERLRDIVGPLLRRGDVADADRVVFALAAGAGITIPDNPLDSADPRTVAEELAAAWVALAAACAVDGVALLVVEDVHWASGSLRDLLDRVASVSAPVVVLLTARPESSAFRGASPDRGVRIVLEPLTSVQGRELIDALLVGGGVPEALRDRILSRAEGNPYFVEELVRRLIDEGVLRAGEAGWSVNEDVEIKSLPDSILALLAARVDRLPAREKRVLQEAAVVGRVFWAEPIARSVRSDVVPDLLDSLLRKDLVAVQAFSTIAGCVEYTFRHGLVRDVAYATLPRSRRAHAHAETGDWLTEVGAERREELAELVAAHYGAAVEDEEAELAWGDKPERGERIRRCAWEALLLAGRVARQRFEMAGAVAYHERALRLARGDAERIGALEELGMDHAVAYQSSRAQEAYAEALELARHHPSSPDRARLCARVVTMVCAQPSNFGRLWRRGELDAVVDEGLAARPEPIDRARLLLGRAMGAILSKGEVQEDAWTQTARVDAARESMELAEELECADVAARAVQCLSSLHWSRGAFEKAREVGRALPRYAEQVRPESDRIALLHGYVSQLLFLDVGFEEALRIVQRTRDVARRISPHEHLHATSLIIWAASRLGRWLEVTDAVEDHLATMKEDTEAACAMTLMAPLIAAATLVHMGGVGRAAAVVDRVVIGDREWEQNGAIVPTLRALYDVARGDPSTALDTLERVLAGGSRDPSMVCAAIGKLEALADLGRWDALGAFLPSARALVGMNALLGPYCLWAEGRRSAALEDTASAATVLSAAMWGFDRIGVVFEAARTREALAGVVESRRDELLAAAHTTYERIGAIPHAERVSLLRVGHGLGGDV